MYIDERSGSRLEKLSVKETFRGSWAQRFEVSSGLGCRFASWTCQRRIFAALLVQGRIHFHHPKHGADGPERCQQHEGATCWYFLV